MKNSINIILSILCVIVLSLTSTSCARKVGCYFSLESDRQPVEHATTYTPCDVHSCTSEIASVQP